MLLLGKTVEIFELDQTLGAKPAEHLHGYLARSHAIIGRGPLSALVDPHHGEIS